MTQSYIASKGTRNTPAFYPGLLCLIVAMLVLVTPSATYGDPGFFDVFETRDNKPTPQTFGDEKLTREELRSDIMNFADRFAGTFGQSMDELEMHLSSPVMRRNYANHLYMTLAANK